MCDRETDVKLERRRRSIPLSLMNGGAPDLGIAVE